MSKTTYELLRVKNYRSLEEVEIPLNLGKLILVTGDNRDKNSFDVNGSGKSSVFEPMYTLLSGKTLRGDSPESASRRGVKNTEIQLVYSREGIEYDLTSYILHKDKGNGYKILINGEDKTPTKIPDQKKLILDSLGMSLSRFLQSVLICRNFTSMTDPEKKKLFEEIMDDRLYDLAHQEATSRTKSHETKINQISSLIVTIEVGIVTLEERLKQDQEEFENYKSSQSEIESQLEKSMKLASDKLVSSDNAISSVQLTIRKLKTDQEEIDLKVDDLTKLSNRLGEQSYKITSSVDVLKERLGIYKRIKTNRSCDVCETENLDPNVYDGKILKCSSDIKELSDELQDVKSKLGDINQQVENANKGTASRKIEISNQESMLNNYKIEFSEAQSNIKRLKSEKSSSQLELKTRQDRVTKTEGEILVKGSDLLENQEILSDLQNQLDNYKFLVKVFSPLGARVEPIGRVMSFVNDRISVYNEVLNDGDPVIEISDRTYLKGGEARPKISIEYVDSEDSYESSSKGERARADLAIQLGLSDFALSCTTDTPNLLIVDEYVDGLDSLGSERFVSLLVDRVINLESTTFLITHNKEIKRIVKSLDGSTAEHWVMIKESGVSRLVMNND